MGVSVRINMDSVDRILLKRALNKNGQVQKFFTHEVRRLSDPYVPMQTGILKDTAVEQTDRITYPQPYARAQYWNNKGDGLRGKQWDKRMWNARGKEIIDSTANYAGGKNGG